MNNNLGALNDYLFETLERLTDDSLSDEELKREIARSQAIANVANSVIKSGELALKAVVTKEEFGLEGSKTQELPKMLETKQ